MSKPVDVAIAAAGGLSQQRHLASIRDGTKVLVPLMVTASAFELFNRFPAGRFPSGSARYLEDLMRSVEWLRWLPEANYLLFRSFFGLVSVFIAGAVAFFIAKSYDSNVGLCAVTSLAVYLCLIPENAPRVMLWGEHASAEFVLSAILTGLVCGELFCRLSGLIKSVKLSPVIPPAAINIYVALLPVVLTLLVCVGGATAFRVYTGNHLFDVINRFFDTFIKGASGSFIFGLAMVVLTSACWLVGVHGMQAFEFLLVPLAAVAVLHNFNVTTGAVEAAPLIFNKSLMDSFVLMGGSGACFSLAIALAAAGRTQRHRKLGVSSIAPTAVNISETIIFGLPIVFNPFFALPFILAPAANYFVAYLAVSSGFMPPAVYIVPWTTPPLLSGFLVTGWAWQGAAVQAVNILLSAIIYTPFVLIFTSRGGKKEKNG